MFEKYRVGVDIGGTNVKIALVDKKGEISHPKTVPTRAEMGYEYTVSNITQCIKDLLADVKQANLTIRNFPATVHDLRKRLKLAEGGTTYLFATTIGQQKILIRCRKCTN